MARQTTNKSQLYAATEAHFLSAPDKVAAITTESIDVSKLPAWEILLPQTDATDSKSSSDVCGMSITGITVWNQDTLDCVIDLMNENKENKHRVLVLNMASDFKPGGGVKTGSGHAQEEEIAVRSNLMVSLDASYGKTKIRYPLGQYQAILSKNITVFRASQDEKHEFLKPKLQFQVDVLSCAALRKPTLLKNGTYSAVQYDLMRLKIEGMLKIAVMHKYHTIVLGAFGCGAFKNPVSEVAKLFKRCISKYQSMKGDKTLKSIAFAVYEKNSKWTPNYDAFCAQFPALSAPSAPSHAASDEKVIEKIGASATATTIPTEHKVQAIKETKINAIDAAVHCCGKSGYASATAAETAAVLADTAALIKKTNTLLSKKKKKKPKFKFPVL
jgi:uncharacterized protein (TIGR02452 family)